MTETIKPTFFVRELQKLDPSEEPGVCDVLAVREDGYRYSHDVYDNHAQAEAAVAEFVSDGETADDWEVTKYPGSKSRQQRKPVMTEIQEVAEAIKLKHGQLWPVTREMAAYIATNEAGDQGHTIVTELVHELLRLNPVTPVAEATANLLVRLDQAYQNLDRLPGDFDTEMDTLSDAELLIRSIHQCLDGKEWDSETCQFIANHLDNHGISIRDFEDDTGLTVVELADKYAGEAGAWGEHPRFARHEWRLEVCSEDTQLGYWDWVVSQIEREEI